MLTSTQISLSELSATRELRLDPHYHELHGRVAPVLGALQSPAYLRSPFCLSMRNGRNLPRSAYLIDSSECEHLYASVAAFSQFALRLDACQGLKSPEEHEYGFAVSEVAINEAQLVVTRSGTPGVAWPGEAGPTEDVILIPSGFVIVVELDTSRLKPSFAAAVLNHPVWRLATAARAGGKRQRNLAQANLEELPLPAVTMATQDEVATLYLSTLEDIREDLSTPESLADVCDSVLQEVADLRTTPFQLELLQTTQVSIAEAAASGLLRLDARHHRSDARRSLQVLNTLQCVPLQSLLSTDIIRAGQPRICSEDHNEPFRVISTGTIQAGQVVEAETKPTLEDDVEAAGEKLVQRGDVLLTMDGEGSIGKAAVFEGDYAAITDSHVAILRFPNREIAYAVACFINSSCGQAYVYCETSGATGQTQISGQTVRTWPVPQLIIQHAEAVSEAYSESLVAYEPLSVRTRNRLIQVSSQVGAVLLRSDAFANPSTQVETHLADTDQLAELLGQLKPEMF